MLTQKSPTCISFSRGGCRQYSTIRWVRRLKKIRLFRGFAIGLIALGSRDQSQLHVEAIEPSRRYDSTVPDVLELAAKHADFQRVLFQMAVNAFKRYMTADRSLPKPSIVGIVHHSEASRPLAGRLARRLRDLDESPCIAGDDERWKPDGDIPFKLVFREGQCDKMILKAGPWIDGFW